MVESLFAYLVLFAIATALILAAQYVDTIRVRSPIKPRRNTSARFVGLNVSSVFITLDAIRRREWKEQLDEVSREIVNVSRLIESYVQTWDLPTDGLECLIARKNRLLARYDRLVGGDLCVSEDVIFLLHKVSRPPKTPPLARRVSALSGVRPRRISQ